MKVIFADPTARWVPFAAGALIVIGVLVAGWWNNYDPGITVKFCAALATAMLVLIVLHGRAYWKGQVATLGSDGMRYELRTTMWAGRGRVIAFAPTEAKEWTATAGSGRTDDGKPKLGTIHFSVRGEQFDLSFVNPKLVNLPALSSLNPSYFAKVKADYPALKSTDG